MNNALGGGEPDTSSVPIESALQVKSALVRIEEGDVAKRLAAWAAIVAVVPGMAGIWGMNFRFMPETESPYGYPLALGAMASVCAFLYYRFRVARWI